MVPSSAQSLCDRLTQKMHENTTTVDVNHQLDTMAELVHRILTYKAIDGSTLQETNSPVMDIFFGRSFSATAAATEHVDRMIRFFGTAFGCSARQFPVSTPLHQGLHLPSPEVGPGDMERFEGVVRIVLLGMGSDEHDLATTVAPFLDQLYACSPVAFCIQPACRLAKSSSFTLYGALDSNCVMEHVLNRLVERTQHPTHDVTLATTEYQKMSVILIMHWILWAFTLVLCVGVQHCLRTSQVAKVPESAKED